MAKQRATIVRGWIGEKVQWEDCIDHRRGTFMLRTGKLQDVKGRNVMINDNWLWLPDLANFRQFDPAR